MSGLKYPLISHDYQPDPDVTRSYVNSGNLAMFTEAAADPVSGDALL